MANSEQTKRALAEGLKTALRSQEFDQITVRTSPSAVK